MSANQFLQYLTQVIFVLIALAVTRGFVRQPTPTRRDIAAFFGIITIITIAQWLIPVLHTTAPVWLTILDTVLIIALPYLLLRLLNDFTTVRTLVLRCAEVGLVVAAISIIVVPQPLPKAQVLLLVLYFCAYMLYVAVAFTRTGRAARGVTRRRMHAIAVGSGLFGLSILVLGVIPFLPPLLGEVIRLFEQFAILASGVAYFIGFATPPLLRRAWQEPELRSFLSHAASLPRLPDTAAIVLELERAAEAALGAPTASIGLWDSADDTLHYSGNGSSIYRSDELIGGRAFTAQRAIFSANAPHDDPRHAETYSAFNATAVLSAPITAGQQRLGVLSVFAPRAPLFAEEDLHLLQLLADQGAVILESRALIDEAARVRAREEATRLKDDFLSAAAHDLKTPLTSIIATAQLLERRALRQPDRPVDPAALTRIVTEALRLRTLVIELLDAARTEQGNLLGRREPVDLVALTEEIGARHRSALHPITIAAPGPLVGSYDRARIAQLIENLVENAIKYSPAGGEVAINIRNAGDLAELTVTDRGIGIPATDLPYLFERFHRGTNVDDRRFAGMGLGLYICRGIVEEHGGRISASSIFGQGSTFRVALPLRQDDGVEPREGEILAQLGTAQER
jgi:signal transduction histidine kinase